MWLIKGGKVGSLVWIVWLIGGDSVALLGGGGGELAHWCG